ncbi:PIN domain-containing protein [Gorgonomyces haynaldii]|nr:PIN domain-containing protein [Gorgonomyces haynaldii]
MIVVLDTNYMISHLEFIQQLSQLIPLHIPYTVVQELDGLKSSATVGNQARSATRFLLEHIERFVMEQESTFVSDDQILNYCRSLSPPVLLLTNDTNLQLKASIHSISVCGSYSGTPNDFYHQYFGSVDDCEMTIADMDAEMKPLDPVLEVMLDIQRIASHLMASQVSKHLETAYGHQWQEWIKQEPYGLLDLFETVKSEWMTAFDNVLPKSLRDQLDALISLSKDMERNMRIQKSQMTRGDLQWMVTQMTGFVNLFQESEKQQFSDMMTSLFHKVQNAFI